MRTHSKNQAREITITPNINPYAEGSAQVQFGNTKVLITASISEELPKWLLGSNGIPERGWITAEYGMLPRSTHSRNKREASSGKQGGRTLEIQRLIGRAMRAAIDDKKIPGLLITIDCDVIVADGGTRTAAITGAWVALCHALNKACSESEKRKFKIPSPLEVKHIMAISCGLVSGNLVVDLCYDEDSQAEFDCNFVVDSKRNIIEIQGTAERASLTMSQIQELFELTKPAFDTIQKSQSSALGDLPYLKIS